MNNEPQIKLPGFLVVMAIVGLFAILGYMDNRDRADMVERTLLEGKVVEALYTHPANDGLRKAAIKYLKSCDHGNADERRRDLENLRAELNKDKS